MNNSSNTHRISFLDSPTFIGLALALAAVPLYLSLNKLNFEETDLRNFQNFIEWFGVPYALVLAAVLVNAWQQFETVERDFDREADAMSTLFQTSLLLDTQKERKKAVSTLKTQIKASIVRYVEHIVNNYETEAHNSDLRKQGDEILRGIRSEIAQVINFKQELLARELLRILNEAQDIRGDRISDSKQRIKKHLWSLSLISSFVWLFPFYALHFRVPEYSAGFVEIFSFVTSLLLGPGLIIGVTFVVVTMLYIIRDLNEPLSGVWALELDSWNDLEEQLK